MSGTIGHLGVFVFKRIFKSRLNLFTATLTALACLSLLGCGQRGIHVGHFGSDRAYCQDENCTDGAFQAQSVPTVAVVSASQVLKSWESCLGVSASNNTRNTFNTNARTIFPAEGEANAATGPVMLQAMTLAGDLCSTLAQREAGMAASERRIFNSVDLGSRQNPLTREVVADVVARVSRSCYGRKPAAEDTDEAYRAMIELGAMTSDGNNKGRTLATMLCTGLMASTAGLAF